MLYSSNMENILEVKNLYKFYKSFEALKGISFNLKHGETLGLLGPNGAGKTTTIQILLQLITPEKGVVNIFGKDAFKNREYVLQRMNFTSAYVHMFGALSVYENLKVFALLYGIKGSEKINKLIKEFDAEDLRNKKAQTLSSGQLTRVMIIKALLNDPDLLLLDEPTSSLDPEMASKFREILKEVRKKRNISILYTSHNMAEIEEMCDRVIFLSHGEIVANDTPQKLTQIIPDHTLRVEFFEKPEKIESFLSDRKIDAQLENNILSIITADEAIPILLQEMYNAGYKIKDISIDEPDLEDVFLKFAREAEKK